MNSEKIRFESDLRSRGFIRIAGLDEAGRGPLAGPVVAAAVLMPDHPVIDEIDDSKVLSPAVREQLFEEIKRTSVGYGIGIVDHETIDRINILRASFLAMDRALACLNPVPDHLLIDGNRFQLPDDSAFLSVPYTLIIDGDSLSYSIGAASVLAKVTRDRIMQSFEETYPGYGFAQHKGYSTVAHRDAIFRLGYSDIHRRSFTVKEQLELQFADPITQD